MELSANVHLSSISNNRYQHIYSSQLYGTFFSIYGRFTITEAHVLTKVDLKLVNYKGILNIGIKSFQPPKIETIDLTDEFINQPEGKKSCLHLEVDLVGFSNNFEAENNCNIPIDVTNSDFYVVVSRYLDEMNTAGINAPIFDEEFHYRDGLRSMPINRDGRDLEKELKSMNPGRICPRGTSKALY